MAQSATSIPVYVEIGSKRTFAGALEWPGWCRSGRDPDAALATLRDYAPRYAKVLQGTDLRFPEITDATELAVLEHLEGNATTDFGAPDMAPASDAEPLSERDIERLSAFLAACWRTFDEAVAAARGKELRKGPRGGGRELDQIVAHVMEAENAYIRGVGGKSIRTKALDIETAIAQTRQAVLEALAASAAGEFPATGPRGGQRWSPRYFVRRTVWHALDHAWEIEDRAI